MYDNIMHSNWVIGSWWDLFMVGVGGWARSGIEVGEIFGLCNFNFVGVGFIGDHSGVWILGWFLFLGLGRWEMVFVYSIVNVREAGGKKTGASTSDLNI